MVSELSAPASRMTCTASIRARCSAPRTVSEGVRSVFPAATSGMYVPEEAREFEPRNVTPTPPRVETARRRSDEVTPFDAELEPSNEAADDELVQNAAIRIAEAKSEAEVTGWLKANEAPIKALPRELRAMVNDYRKAALKRFRGRGAAWE